MGTEGCIAIHSALAATPAIASKVFYRIIEGPTLEQGFVQVRLSSAEQERVAIRAGARDSRSTERRTTAADVFNHDCSDEGFHFVRQWATDKVECAAWRKRYDKPNGLSRVGLRPHDARDDWQSDSAGNHMQKFATEKLHGRMSLSCRARTGPYEPEHSANASSTRELAVIPRVFIRRQHDRS